VRKAPKEGGGGVTRKRNEPKASSKICLFHGVAIGGFGSRQEKQTCVSGSREEGRCEGGKERLEVA